MDLEGITLSEINQERKTNTIWFHLHVEPKNKTNKLKKKKKRKQAHRTETKGMVKGGGWGMSEKGKGNIVNNIVVSLRSDKMITKVSGVMTL